MSHFAKEIVEMVGVIKIGTVLKKNALKEKLDHEQL